MAKRTDVYDGRGKKIGTIHHEISRDNYYDPAGRFLGSTDRNGTRDRIGRIVADKPSGGLLWKKRDR
jgi:hypothetical protein